MKLAEDATGLPMLLQGQQGTAPDTVGGGGRRDGEGGGCEGCTKHRKSSGAVETTAKWGGFGLLHAGRPVGPAGEENTQDRI